MRVLRAVLVAPSYYHNGEVVVFRIGTSPNGALTALAGLAEDYNQRHAGRSCIDFEFFDEHVQRAVTPDVLRPWRDGATAAGQRFVLMLCGIQTTMYPRARDIALMARREGIDVMCGGVHLAAHGPSVDFLVSCGVRVAIGEVEPIWDDIIEDALNGQLRPIYRIRADQGIRVKSSTSYMTAPDISDTPFPHIPRAVRRKYLNSRQAYVESSRGCPFLCTFCVIKNVFGRTVRSRDPKQMVAWMVERVRQDGIRLFAFNDDNFVRNPRHIELLEELAAARSQGHKFAIGLILDVESTCYAREDSARGQQSREFLRLCKAAGVMTVYMGLESTNDAVLQEARKGVNRDREDVHTAAATIDFGAARQRLIRRYKTAVQAWHDIGAWVETAYILGFEADRPGLGAQAVHDLLEIGVDSSAFFMLTPLPGSEDYARAVREGRLASTDFNDFFSHRPNLIYSTLSAAELQQEVQTAVRLMWNWRRVVGRVARALLGIGRARVITPWTYVKRQFGYQLMLSTGLNTFYEAGIFRRHGAWSAKREVITDEEARHFYLGELSGASGLPAILRDDSVMESLPVLGTALSDEPGAIRLSA